MLLVESWVPPFRAAPFRGGTAGPPTVWLELRNGEPTGTVVLAHRPPPCRDGCELLDLGPVLSERGLRTLARAMRR